MMSVNSNVGREMSSKVACVRHDMASDSVSAHEQPSDPEFLPRMHTRVIDRVALVRFTDADILFEDAAVQKVMDRLGRLLAGEGHTRLVLNLQGVRYVSSAFLGRLVSLRDELERGRGYLRLCALDTLVQDMMRICTRDRGFDICADEPEALGLLVR
jgi:anti-anti-sigma factor